MAYLILLLSLKFLTCDPILVIHSYNLNVGHKHIRQKVKQNSIPLYLFIFIVSY
jgi:hypothetical protein